MNDSFIDAVINQESSGDPKAVSPKGAMGLMQIMPGTLQEYNQYNKTAYQPKDLLNGDINKKIGTWYMYRRIPQMINHYRPGEGFTPEDQLWAYNAGLGNWNKGIKPAETKNYVEKIMKSFEEPPYLRGK